MERPASRRPLAGCTRRVSKTRPPYWEHVNERPHRCVLAGGMGGGFLTVGTAQASNSTVLTPGLSEEAAEGEGLTGS